MNKTRIALIILGSVFTALGTVGIFIPILPTTPFLLLAAFCYGKSSDRFYKKLLNHRVLGAYIRSYLDGKGVPLHSKIYALILLWLSIGSSALFLVDSLIIKILLLLIAIGVTIHILSLKTAEKV